MGVIYMQMYGSVDGGMSKRNKVVSSSAAANSNGRRSSTRPKRKASQRLQKKSSRSSTFEARGRPPQHPSDRTLSTSSLSTLVSASAITTVSHLDIDEYRNEKFPAEIIARIEHKKTTMDHENHSPFTLNEKTVLSDEMFRMMLGTKAAGAEDQDSVRVKEAAVHRNEESIANIHFECLDVWT